MKPYHTFTASHPQNKPLNGYGITIHRFAKLEEFTVVAIPNYLYNYHNFPASHPGGALRIKFREATGQVSLICYTRPEVLFRDSGVRTYRPTRFSSISSPPGVLLWTVRAKILRVGYLWETYGLDYSLCRPHWSK